MNHRGRYGHRVKQSGAGNSTPGYADSFVAFKKIGKPVHFSTRKPGGKAGECKTVKPADPSLLAAYHETAEYKAKEANRGREQERRLKGSSNESRKIRRGLLPKNRF